MSIHSSTQSQKSATINNKNDNNADISPQSQFSSPIKMAHFIFPTPDCALDVFQQKPLAKQKQKILESIIPIRFVVLTLSLGCLSLIVANSLALNFTVICMHKELPSAVYGAALHAHWTNTTTTSTISTNENKNIKEQPLESMFTISEQSWLFSAIAIGQLMGTLPITYFVTNFGLRKMFTLYGLISSISTLLIPASIEFTGFSGLMVMRVLQGVSIATVMVVTGAVSAEWSPLSSAGIFLTILTINYQLGPITAMPLAGALCSSETFGWTAIYYLLGTISLFFLLFFIISSVTLRENKISARELEIIEKGKWPIEGRQHNESSLKERIPYREIFLDPVFWAITISNATANMAFQVFWQYGPLYLNKVLGIEVAETGVAAALPYILSAFVKIIAAQISDRFNCVSEKVKVILFASISQYVMCCCFLAMALLPKMGFMDVLFMQFMFTASTVFSGLNAVGVVKSTHLVSRQFSHVLFSWETLILSVVSLLLPLGINFLTPTHSVDEWANVFLFVTAFNLIGTTFFNIYAEVEPREWTKGHMAKSSLTYPESFGIEEGKKFSSSSPPLK